MKRAHRSPTCSGFSLVELVVFIVVFGVLVAGLVAALTTPLSNSPKAGQIDRATEIAQQRMELILAQRRTAGFATFVDPCPGPAVCTAPAGYSVSASIVGNWVGDVNYKVITVNVTGSSVISATALVANY